MIEVPGTAPVRKALEAAAITLYRVESGRSPVASFGRIPAGYRISSGNNARLPAAGRRYRGAPDPAASTGLYRVRSGHHAGLVYVGQGAIAPRIWAHAAKAITAGHRQGPYFRVPPWRPGSRCLASRPSACSSTRTTSSPPTSWPRDTH